ncbi:MAG: hypothetical protein LBI84_01945 [Propionibacteriaceae bacterium]|jgi:hypothetical protein|nr:hypothetical protein [Propionibacteriaceae bacterium]
MSEAEATGPSERAAAPAGTVAADSDSDPGSASGGPPQSDAVGEPGAAALAALASVDAADPEPGEQPGGRPRWVRNLAIGIGVPLAATAIFVTLVVTGVIRDSQRAAYCSVYAEASAPLVPLYSEVEEALVLGDPGAVLSVVLDLRSHIDALDAAPSTHRIDARLRSMTAYLQRVEVAARARDEEGLADLALEQASFRSDRQAFLIESAEYCRYR